MPSKANRIFSGIVGRACAVALFAAILSAAPLSFAQEDDERRLWDSEFLKKRTAAKPAAPKTNPAKTDATKTDATKTDAVKTSVAPRKAPAYRRATPKTSAVEPDAPAEVVGITIWRLRPAAAADNKDTRLLLQDAETKDSAEWTPERVEAETVFATGDRVRLGVESPRDGYLYVIDREQYADGSTSDPYLIFPALNIRNGDNAVTAGKVIEMPSRSAFQLKPMRADYKGELLTLIVTPQPIAELKAGNGLTKLESKTVEQWEKQWSAPVERFEMIGGAGKTYTKAEKEAGVEGRLLTQEDELPQTLYRVAAKPGSPVVIAVSLKIEK